MTRALEELAAQLADPSPEVRRRAAQGLGEVDAPGIGALVVRALSDEDWRVRKEAVAASAGVARRGDLLRGLGGAPAHRDDAGLRKPAAEAPPGAAFLCRNHT